jgi:cell division protein FtsI/penicillin-binding protein 2
MHRSWAGVVAAAVLLTACQGGGEDTPDPEPVAESLADALVTGDLTPVPWTDETAPEAATTHARIVDGMGEVTPAVRVGDVTEREATDTEPATATATLSWAWPLGEQEEWSYATEAALTLVDGEWRVTWDPALVEPSLHGAVVLDATPIAAPRGDLVGAGGVRLVTPRPVVRFGIDRSQVDAASAGDSARQLARLLYIDPGPYVKRVEAAGDKAFVEALVLRREAVSTRLREQYQRIEGAHAIADDAPLAVTADFAAPILGRVGEVTAEMIADDPERYRLGDVAGLSGLQARYDDQLTGTPGLVVDAVAADGKERELFRVDPTPGTALELTLDQDLQLAAERILAPVEPAAALVAIRPSTGAVLAAANGPGTGGVNIATYGQAAPGSTFKTVSSLALLRAGLGPQSPVPCTSSIVVDGKTFTNYDDYPPGGLGSIPLRTAVANSCNTAFISQADRLGRSDLADAAASLGLGVDHDLGFPAYFGQVPSARSGTEAAADMIGQGAVLASPMVMATVMASVQAGHTVVPRLVDSVDVAVPPEVSALTPAETRSLRGLLRGVVTGGSGALLADVPGPPVIAKTGTAEFDRESRRLTHAWMIAAQGDLAVAVFVDVGRSGSGTAGPLLEAFLRAAR